VYAQPGIPAELGIVTHYEKLDIAQSKKIFYLEFSLPDEPLPLHENQLQELLKEVEKTN
jgi:hypothetical protein